MVRHDGSFVKVERMVQIAKKIATGLSGPEHVISHEKLILWIELNIGLSPEKAEAYVKKICDGHGWVIEDDAIKPEPAS